MIAITSSKTLNGPRLLHAARLHLGSTLSMHILITVNAAWNVLNFRRPIVAAMIADGHRVTVLAPYDDSVATLESLGCKVPAFGDEREGSQPVAGYQTDWADA